MGALLTMLMLAPLAAVTAADTARPTRPNILLHFADDLGYGDLGCYGGNRIWTPHLDRLAAEGMRFTSFYSAHAVCSPARFGMQCGRVPFRAGIFSYIPLGSEMQIGRYDETIGGGKYGDRFLLCVEVHVNDSHRCLLCC